MLVAAGAAWADFEEMTDAEERALLQRDAYERDNALLALLR